MIVDVEDLNLRSINFLKSYDDVRKKKANKLYAYRCVNINSVELMQVDLTTNVYKIEAYVNGEHSDYCVRLKIKNNNLLESSCTCPDFEKGNLCKHILATCMEVVDPQGPSTKKRKEELLAKKRQEKEERERIAAYNRKYSEALNMLRSYKTKSMDYPPMLHAKNLDVNEIYKETINKLENENNLKESLNTNIKIEPKISIVNHKTIEVSFKIGQTTLYVVKDIMELYEAFLEERIIQYGKKLKFKATLDSFVKEDRNLINMILEYAEMLLYYNQSQSGAISYRYNVYNTYNILKYIKLYDKKIDLFFEMLKDREVILEMYDFKFGRYTFTDEKLPLNIKIINKNKNEYSMKLNIKDYNFLIAKEHIYVVYNEKIYTIEKNDSNINLLNTFENNHEILVPVDKKEEFATYVLPRLYKYIQDGVNESNKADNSNIQNINKLASKVYLDLDEKGNIKLKLTSCYDDKEFNVLDKNCEKYIKANDVKRNLLEERKVLERLFLDGFEIAKSKDYFILKNEDLVYDFLLEKIEGYMNDFEVLATSAFKNKRIKKPRISNISVSVDEGLLQIDMSKIDIDVDEIKKILQSYNIKKRYYKLKDGDLLQLDQDKNLDFLNDISNNLDVDFSKLNNGVLKLPVNRSIYLEKLLEKNTEIKVTKNDEYNQLINNISDKNFSDKISVSKSFDKVLRPYQKVGYKWLKVLENYNFGGILADDMGLGKTLQIIALLESSLKSKNRRPSIVVSPSSLVLNWKLEIEKWCPKIKLLIIKGDLTTRKELIGEYDKYDLIITSYDLLKRDVNEYENKKFKYIIADEAQYIKNFSTQNATSLKSLEGQARFALTGTPIENSISELWSIFDFVMPGYLYTYSKFKKKFEEPILKNDDKKTLERLKTLIDPFILRRIKKDVLTELPEKNITILKSEMEKEQENLYYSYMAQIKKEVAAEVNVNGFEKSKLKILMLLTRLRQICCHPSLFIENYKGKSGKLNQCLDIVGEAISSGHKILLFSQYTSMFEIIEKEFEKLNIKYYKLTGSTPVDKRIDMVENFNKNEDVKIFLISLKAGGTGLNLTSADVVIHYDPWWNLSSENQATDRAYRIGQKIVFRYIS